MPGGQRHVFRPVAFGVEKHAELGPVRKGFRQLQILPVVQGRDIPQFVGANAACIAELDGFYVVFDQAPKHQNGQVRGKAFSENVGTVPQGAVHEAHRSAFFLL